MLAQIAPALARTLARLLLACLCLVTIWWLSVLLLDDSQRTWPAQLDSLVTWGQSLLTGEWGYSRRTGEAVTEAIARRAPTTLLVLALSAALAAAMGWATALIASRQSDSATALLLGRLGRCLRGTPAFVLAMAFVSVFSYYFNWLPAVVLEIDTSQPRAVVHALIMPVLTLAALYWARLLPALYARRKPHRSPGLGQHLLYNFAWAVSALLVVDAVFALPGLGRWLFASTRFADIAAVQGVAVACVLVLLIVNAILGRRPEQRCFSALAEPSFCPAMLVPRLWLSVCWLSVIVVLCIFAAWLPLNDPDAIDLARSHAPPSGAHWLGTDALGRDMLALLAHGGQVAVLVALSACVLGCGIGVSLGWCVTASSPLLRACTGFLCNYLRVWPPVVLLMLIALAGWPGGYITLTSALALMAAPRFVWANEPTDQPVQRARRRQFVFQLVAQTVRTFGTSLAIVALLGFMRLIPPDDAANWGAAMAQGREHLGYAPAMVWLPALTLWLTLLASQQIAESISQEQQVGRVTVGNQQRDAISTWG